MNAREGRPSSHEVGAQQSTRTTTHTTTTPLPRNGYAVSTPSHRRWRKRPRTVTVTASDVVVWVVVTALTAGFLIGLCALLTLAWPS